MPKLVKPLKALEVGRLKTAGYHAVGTVAGLYLNVGNNPESRSWICRLTTPIGRREIGLGAYPDTTLAMAHEKARILKEQIKQGIDPLLERQAAKIRLQAAHAKALTFEQVAGRYIDTKAHEWKNIKHREQWQTTLNTYAYPIMGSLFVSQIERAQVLAVLEPIWLNKTETANRLRGRIEKILDYAKALNLRSGDNPAAWKGGLETILAKPSKIQMIVHHAALEHNNIGMFMADLRVINSMAARCLEFCILTATRSGEARGTRWSEIDLEAALWHIPAERMKAGKPHTVPLSMQVQALLKALPCVVGADYVFPAAKKLRPLSDMTLTTVLRRMDLQVTTHGFRSTFRDWAADCTHIDRQTCEQALAHQLPDKVEAAYLRSNLLLKRRPLMQQWADRCDILQT